MRNLTFGLALGLVLSVTLTPGAAAAWTEIDPEPLIERCWSISEEDRDSDITPRIRQGMNNTVDCLEAEIIRHAIAFFRIRNDELIRQMVLGLGKSYGDFYWMMYNDNKGCELMCPMGYRLFHLSRLAALLEDILRDVISQRNEYRR